MRRMTVVKSEIISRVLDVECRVDMIVNNTVYDNSAIAPYIIYNNRGLGPF